MKNVIKNMKKRINGLKPIKRRTTINVDDELLRQATERMIELRRGSFSNYVENLIAEDVRASETKEPVPA